MKEELLKRVKEKVQLRINEARKAIEAAQSAANEETKSSAGDKYETGRAMAQNDRDMYARQLIEAERDMAVLEGINPEVVTKKIGVGSLVESSMGWMWLATSVGQVKMENRNIMVLSPESPIGAAVLGLEIGDKTDFRGNTIKILGIS